MAPLAALLALGLLAAFLGREAGALCDVRLTGAEATEAGIVCVFGGLDGDDDRCKWFSLVFRRGLL